jgi:glycosyltransferase involved in cell wall biosynthesis
MKILYHHRTMGKGAEGVHIASMVRALESLGHQVQVLSPPSVDPLREAGSNVFEIGKAGSTGGSPLGETLKSIARNAPQFLFEIFELFYNIHAAAKIRQAVKTFNPDLYYERYAFFTFCGSLISSGRSIPFVLEVNEISGIKRFRGQTFTRLATWIERKILSRADLIIVVSSFLKKKIVAKGVPGEKILVLPNGVDIDKFQPEHNGERIRTKYRFGEQDVVIGFVGWFAEWDRLDELILVIERLAAFDKNVKLMLVGDGQLRESLEELVSERGLNDRVTITGAVPRDEIQEYLAAIDIGVLPHSNDFGSPIVLFEFMAMKKPVVAPTLDPITDVIRDQVNGVLFPAGDFIALETSLMPLIGQKESRERLGANARREIQKRHTWRKKAESLLQALRKQRPVE